MADTIQPLLPRVFCPPNYGECITSDLTKVSYTITGRIGQGSFSEVYSCIDFWGNDLAAKVLKARRLPYEKIKASAEAEFQKLLHFRNPNITYIYDAFECRDTFFIIMEKCSYDLNTLLKVPGFDGKFWVIPIAKALLQAMHFIHLHDYVHQDIHLGNVFTNHVTDQIHSPIKATNFKLADLGIARLRSQVQSSNTWAPWTRPPESIRPLEFGVPDKTVDIYHCALVLLQLAKNQRLDFTEQDVLEGKPRKLAESMNNEFSFALSKALRRHSINRTASAMEFWRDLQNESKPISS